MRPKKLNPGDTIGIIAPASPAASEDIEQALQVLYGLGYRAKLGHSVYQSRGYLAGSDEIRARDINQMFADREIKAIFCLRGGYGSQRILSKIDYNVIRKNPKIFMGYSDITALLNTIYQKCGFNTFHGPMLTSDMSRSLDAFTESWFTKVLCNAEAIGEVSNPESFALQVLAGGKARGRLAGGNLSLIASLMGTKYEIDTKDRILFLEDVGEEPYRIDRMLNQLLLGGKLQAASAIVLCDFKNCQPKEEHKSLQLIEVFEDMLAGLGKPVIFGYKIGHCNPQITIPLGVKAVVDGDGKSLTLLEAAVT